MLRTIMRSRSVLPNAIWQPLRNAYWRSYWRAEEQAEAKALGRVSPIPIAGSERAVLAEAIGDNYPFSSLLEIGCAYGQNFHGCAAQFPGAEFIGIDLDAARIAEGQAFLARRGFSNVSLLQGDASDLTRFPDGRFDLVITCAALLFIGPEQIHTVLAEMLRVCRKRLLLLEQHAAAAAPPHGIPAARRDGTAYWVWDFYGLFAGLGLPQQALSVERVPNPRWPAEQWQDCACLISVTPGK